MTSELEIQAVCNVLNRELKTNVYYVEYAYGRPRLVARDKNGVRDISPRLPRPRMLEWLWAYVDGARAAESLRRNQKESA